jgi:hypothetical protein
MKKFLLLGLTALGLMALAPTKSEADEGVRVYIGPAYPHYRHYYYHEYYRHHWHRWHHRHHRYYYRNY